MHKEIAEKLTPVIQIIEHQVKKKAKEQEGLRFNVSDNSGSHSQTVVAVASAYLTLIHETDGLLASESNVTSYVPLISLESTDIALSTSTQVKLDGNSRVQTTVSNLRVPFAVYYFNHALNFYEPFIEKTQVELCVESTKRPAIKERKEIEQSQTKVNFKKLCNVNVSLAFFDAVWRVQSAFKQLEQSRTESDKASSQSAASYFVKNNTGEKLMFKTKTMLQFQEIKAGEECSLDLQLMQSQSQHRKLQTT